MQIQPDRMRTGLLGGSGKPSKLAALAAARRKKKEEELAAQAAGSSAGPERSISLLDRLGAKKEGDQPREAVREDKPIPIRRKSTPPKPVPSDIPASKRERIIHPKEPSPQPTPQVRRPSGTVAKADPSAFASALLGASSRQPESDDALAHPSSFAVSFFPLKSFAGPSPDDVVLAAQSKAPMGSVKTFGNIDQN